MTIETKTPEPATRGPILGVGNAAAAEELAAVKGVHAIMGRALSGEASPSERSTAGLVARMLLHVLAESKDESKGKDRPADPPLGDTTTTKRLPRGYEVQPVGIPTEAGASLEGEAIETVFGALLSSVRDWEAPDDLAENMAAHRTLDALIEALLIMNRAYLTNVGPLEQAHNDDEAAAEEWKRDRWFARTQPGRFTPRGCMVADDEAAATAGEGPEGSPR